MKALKNGLVILCLLLNLVVNGQNNIILSELPGVRNKEDFIGSFFNDYKGMLWFNTVNKVYRFTGGKDELGAPSIDNRYIIKEAKLFDSCFLISYKNNVLLKFNIKTGKTKSIELPVHLKKNTILLAEKDWFLIFSVETKYLYKLNLNNLRNEAIIADSFKMTSNVFKYAGNGIVIKGDQTDTYLHDLKTGKQALIAYDIDKGTIQTDNNRLIYFIGDKFYFSKYTRTIDGGFIITSEMADNSKKYNYTFAIKNYTFYCGIGTNFYYLRDSTGHINRFRFINSDGLPYHFPSIYTVYIDPMNRFFISTEKGVYYFDLKAIEFMDFNLVNTSVRDPSSQNIEIRNAFYNEKTQELHLGLRQEGIYKYTYDPISGRFQYKIKIDADSKKVQNTITNIYFDNRDQMWVSTNYKTINYTKGSEHNITSVWNMAEDADNYWIASANMGLQTLSKKTNEIHTYNYMDKDFTDRKLAWHLLFRDNYVYVSSHHGVFVFDKVKGNFDNPLNKTFNQMFKDQMCWMQTPDFHNKDYSFISTQGSGLYHISYEGKNKTRLLRGIDEIYQCYSGPIGNLASSSHNLYFFENASSNHIRFEPGVYQLPGSLAFRGFCNIGNDKLCITGGNGFTIIDLQKFKDHIKNISPSFFIQDVEVINHITYHYPESKDIIKLKYFENNIKITVNSNWIGSIADMNIYYLFRGSKDTFRLTNTNEISFSNLAPGNYDLKIFCQAANGVWNREPLMLTLSISAPWYASIAAKVVYIILGILLLILIFQLYKKEMERTRRYQLIKLESELKSLRSQMNPHFMFNALNAIQQFILNNDKEKANIYLSDFSRLIRQTLNNSSKETLPLKEETDWLNNYLNLEKLRYKGKFEYEIQVGDGIPANCEIPSMMVQPFVENAVNHGIFNKEGKGNLKLSFNIYKSNLIKCIVSDDGIGIKAANEIKKGFFKYESKGISITEQRMMYINQKYKTKGNIEIEDIIDKNGNACGTKVVIILPFIPTI